MDPLEKLRCARLDCIADNYKLSERVCVAPTWRKLSDDSYRCSFSPGVSDDRGAREHVILEVHFKPGSFNQCEIRASLIDVLSSVVANRNPFLVSSTAVSG